MTNRRFEMYHYRQILVRMRQGDSDREIARSKAMGRRKVAKVRSVAAGLGWLSPDAPLPDDATLAVRFDCREGLPVSCVSTLEPWRGQIAQWHAQGIQATTIHAALARNHFWVWSTERSGRSASRSPLRLIFFFMF